MNTPEINSNDRNARLRAAVRSVEAPPFLDARIRATLRDPQPARPWFSPILAPAGIVLTLLVGLGIAYQVGHLRWTVASQESFIASISSKLIGLMRIGLGDHVHCAFFRDLPDEPPPVQTIESSLGPEHRNLATLVKRHAPAAYQLVLGHTCHYRKREFVHLAMQGDGQLLSLVVTPKRTGESFDLQGVLPELVNAGIPLYQSAAQRFQIAAMETDGYLVYVISDLPAGRNMDLMVTMAPELRAFLNSLEG